MTDLFPIVEVPETQADAPEAMGTKQKFWYFDSSTNQRFLFKRATPGTGEDWAEKIAAELCSLINIPHASYELAICNGERGCISPKFVPEGASLLHGNEILLAVVPDYPGGASGSRNFYRISQHRIDLVCQIVKLASQPFGWTLPEKIETALQTFIGYILLDAWIGNADRHHENWGLIVIPNEIAKVGATLHLAPTYDHASSLGRNESDTKRRLRLEGKNPQFTVARYAQKCRSAFFENVGDARPLTTFDAAAKVAMMESEAAKTWIDAISNVSMSTLETLFGRIPPERISPEGVEFALKVLQFNRGRLILLREALS